MTNRKCILVSGGARSGKSSFAQELAESISEKVLFVATAEPLNEDMKNRISKHKAQRPKTWNTIEAAIDIVDQIAPHIHGNEVVLVDCLTLLTSNIILGKNRELLNGIEIDEETAEKKVLGEIESILALMSQSDVNSIFVTNEVGFGIVPDNELGRIYRDLLGRVNQVMARHADEVYLLVSGISLKIKG